MTRGGRRLGAGRPRSKTQRRAVTVRLGSNASEALDGLCKRLEASQSVVVGTALCEFYLGGEGMMHVPPRCEQNVNTEPGDDEWTE